MTLHPPLLVLAWLGVAFAFGVVAARVRQPPLIGYLVAGFVLEGLGFTVVPSLQAISDIGLLILLFTIGLKLDLGTVIRPEVWAPTLLHMGAVVVAAGALLFGLGQVGVPLLSHLSWTHALVVGFALSFSSTVFAVKVLETRGDLHTIYGQVAIGVLVVQDLVAVIFLAASKGKIPSPWAIAVLGLPLLRRPLGRLLRFCGHGELLVLAGVVVALGSAALFEAVGLKDGLGALAAGALLASDPKGRALAKNLIGLKDVLLVGFFLTVGLTGVPSAAAAVLAVALVVLVPLKVGLFFLLFARFRLRARSSWLSAASLGNYSEFGLIVAALAVGEGWLSSTWLVGLAIALAVSFAVAAPLNARAATIYQLRHPLFERAERPERLPAEVAVDASEAEVLVFGMGRIGTGAYDALSTRFGDAIVGFDVDEEVLARHGEAGRRVHRASATDGDLWDRLRIDPQRVRLVLLTMASLQENVEAIEILRRAQFPGAVAVAARYADDVKTLREAGADSVFHALEEAGAGFAQHVVAGLVEPPPASPSTVSGS